MELEHSFYAPDRESWRKWLEQNHATEKEVWLFRYKKASSTPSVTYDEALEEALSFGWIDGKVKSVDEEKSAIRFSPRKPRSVWSKINKNKAERLIQEGKMTPAGLAKIEEAKKSGAWDKAYITGGPQEIPADLVLALKANKEAWKVFQAFSNSHRNAYIHWINDAKAPATRQRRIAETIKRITAPTPPPSEKWWQNRR